MKPKEALYVLNEDFKSMIDEHSEISSWFKYVFRIELRSDNFEESLSKAREIILKSKELREQ